MSLATNLSDAFTRVATENKSLRTLLNGNAADNSALTTTAKANLVAAINELDAAIDSLVASGSATTLDELTDVVITAVANGHILNFNGTNWVNVLGTTLYDPAGSADAAQAAAEAASQPLDSDLTDIAGQANTAYGKALLTLADQAALKGLLPTATELATGLVELATTTEATTGTDTTRAVTPAGLQANVNAAINGLIDAAPGTLDTLNELAAALGDDPNFAATINTALANRVRVDAAQTFTTLQQDQARANINAASASAVGDTSTDFVAVFEAGLV